jgi:hypothetical protein
VRISGDWRDSSEAALGFLLLALVGGCLGVAFDGGAPAAARIGACLIGLAAPALFCGGRGAGCDEPAVVVRGRRAT